jgi:hypothetical protein
MGVADDLDARAADGSFADPDSPVISAVGRRVADSATVGTVSRYACSWPRPADRRRNRGVAGHDRVLDERGRGPELDAVAVGPDERAPGEE